MSELISHTRAFLHRTPTEPVNYTGDVAHVPEPCPEKNRKRLKMSMLAAVGYLAFVAVDNAAFYYETAGVSADTGTILYDIEGCEPFPNAEEIQNDEKKKATNNVEKEFNSKVSAASKFELFKFNPVEFTLDWFEIHTSEQFSFTSEISGLEIHVYSDTDQNPFKIEDIEESMGVIDELIHSSLDERLVYEHVGVAAYVDCLRKRFIDADGPRELVDERLNIYVPSKPGVCFSDGLVKELPKDKTSKEFCDSIGGTKEIRFSVWPFYEYRHNWMVLMTTSTDPETAEYRLSKKLGHESDHFLMEESGMHFDYDGNEGLAQYQEREVMDQLYAEDIPVSFAYPDETYEEVQD